MRKCQKKEPLNTFPLTLVIDVILDLCMSFKIKFQL